MNIEIPKCSLSGQHLPEAAKPENIGNFWIINKPLYKITIKLDNIECTAFSFILSDYTGWPPGGLTAGHTGQPSGLCPQKISGFHFNWWT